MYDLVYFDKYFYPRPPGGGRLNVNISSVNVDNFYPRPPGGGRRAAPYIRRCAAQISIHALRVEGDRVHSFFIPRYADFYPRPPGGGRQNQRLLEQYIRFISIHALRVEGDRRKAKLFFARLEYFYPRPPGGGRLAKICLHFCELFYFYPRPPGGGRRIAARPKARDHPISIHALRVEGDFCRPFDNFGTNRFLSTPSGWRATTYVTMTMTMTDYISIHALRVEGDLGGQCYQKRSPDFYPRPPGGGRPRGGGAVYKRREHFYPRPPGGGRHRDVRKAVEKKRISIHALRVEGDFASPPNRCHAALFLSTPSGWRATAHKIIFSASAMISIHALRVEGDQWDTCNDSAEDRFLSTPSGWRATA